MKQIPAPFEIFGIILVAFNSHHPFRIRNRHTDSAFFKDVEHRTPILAGRLHTDIGAIVQMEPIGKAAEIGSVSRKAFLLIMRLHTVSSGNDCSYQEGFEDVYSTANWINNFQVFFLLIKSVRKKAVTESSHIFTGAKTILSIRA